MREPAVGGRTVPVDHVRCDLDDVAREKLPGLLAPFLVEAASGRYEQQLAARVAVPVVAAAGFEGDVVDRAVQRSVPGQGRQVGLSDEILSVGWRVGLALREDLVEFGGVFHGGVVCCRPGCCSGSGCEEQQAGEGRSFHVGVFVVVRGGYRRGGQRLRPAS